MLPLDEETEVSQTKGKGMSLHVGKEDAGCLQARSPGRQASGW